MKVLFIGGTGIISSACSHLAVMQGIELFIMNRGLSTRTAPLGAVTFIGDIRRPESVKNILSNQFFDAVVDWVAYTPEHIKVDLELFRGKTDQFIFISSASAYQKPPKLLPIKETTVLDNPFWQYSRDKIACEKYLMDSWDREKFPVTIVRPSHTYDPTYIPVHGGWTFLDRIIKGKEVIVHGDGTSLWTLTHNSDFAIGFIGLLGNIEAIGDVYQITSDEWLSWDMIVETLSAAAGYKPKIIHVPSDLINVFDPIWGASLLGDKAHSAIFDNSKIKRAVPGYQATTSFAAGARQIIDWYTANPSWKIVDDGFNDICNRIISAQKKAFA